METARSTVCGSCGELERPHEAPHRRGRCSRCYEKWIRTRPVGLGAVCYACGDRRHADLRHFELRQAWLVLCYNCAARAEALRPEPNSLAGLRLRLHRQRRWGDRRAESVGAARVTRSHDERRAGERRVSGRDLLDATEYAELVLELEAEFGNDGAAESFEGPLTRVFDVGAL